MTTAGQVCPQSLQTALTGAVLTGHSLHCHSQHSQHYHRSAPVPEPQATPLTYGPHVVHYNSGVHPKHDDIPSQLHHHHLFTQQLTTTTKPEQDLPVPLLTICLLVTSLQSVEELRSRAGINALVVVKVLPGAVGMASSVLLNSLHTSLVLQPFLEAVHLAGCLQLWFWIGF